MLISNLSYHDKLPSGRSSGGVRIPGDHFSELVISIIGQDLHAAYQDLAVCAAAELHNRFGLSTHLVVWLLHELKEDFLNVLYYAFTNVPAIIYYLDYRYISFGGDHVYDLRESRKLDASKFRFASIFALSLCLNRLVVALQLTDGLVTAERECDPATHK